MNQILTLLYNEPLRLAYNAGRSSVIMLQYLKFLSKLKFLLDQLNMLIASLFVPYFLIYSRAILFFIKRAYVHIIYEFISEVSDELLQTILGDFTRVLFQPHARRLFQEYEFPSYDFSLVFSFSQRWFRDFPHQRVAHFPTFHVEGR